MSKIEVDAIDKQSGSTLTLGGSGTAVTLACGATQTGFGRTGTVDWNTTPKTATFTAVSGDGFFANTSGSAFNMNLPAGSAGAIVSVADYAGTWQTNNLTVVPNGTDKIGGLNANVALDTEGQSVTFIFVDSTQGWINTMDSTSNVRAATFICASVSGACNTLTTVCTNFKLATFTGPGTFTVNSIATAPANNNVDYIIVAGGGGGGSGISGGGGAGGYLFSKGTSTGCYAAGPAPLGRCAVAVTAQGYPIAVGGGGPGELGPTSTTQPPARSSDNGGPSTGLGLTATGGGFGGNGQSGGEALSQGGPGGSGGGGGYYSGPAAVATGNSPPVSPPQGNPGGKADTNPSNWPDTGGGGGASAAGSPGDSGASGAGGAGLANSITGSSVSRAGGGGGSNYGPTGRPAGAGGAGGGGAGGLTYSPTSATSGTVNTGGGGGGGGEAPNPSPSPTSNNSGPGGNGGSGIVMIRYRFQ